MSNNKLEAIVKEQGLVKSDVAKMVEAFGGPFEEAGEILANYKKIKVTSEKDTEAMALARTQRLTLKGARTTVENKRKELKADIVKQGRAIDTIARYVKEEIEPAEEYLKLQEDFVKIKKEKEAETLRAERTEKLMQYTDDISVYNLDNMMDAQFDSLLATLKAQHEAKLQAEADAKKKAEEEAEAERKRQAEIEKENARLKKEAEAKEAEREKERKAEAEKQAKIKAEADAKLEEERKKREALEAEQREKAEADRKAKEAEEEKERQALLAPDKQKLINFAQGLEVVRSDKLPAVKTNKAQELVNYVDSELKRISNYIVEQAKEL